MDVKTAVTQPAQPDNSAGISPRWNAILLAGDRPGGDPLAQHFGVASKALVPIGGRAMAAHGLATLLAHPRIAQVTVLAQDPEGLLAHADLSPFRDDPKLHLARSGQGIAGSVAATLRALPDPWPVLVTTADHVLLDRAMLDWMFDHAGGSDVAVGLVSRAVIEAEQFDTRRTWLRFRDADVTGANLFALTTPRAFAALDYWQGMEAHRKSPLRLAWGLGPVLLLAILLRRLSVAAAFAAIGRKLGVSAAPILIPHARAGV
ncbi:MAG: hypothetical protein RLZZ08_1956, partial [Pseudomonadota bacterium]